MQYTQNLSLKKPEATEYVKIVDLNENADILDAKIGDLNNLVVKLEKEIDSANLKQLTDNFLDLLIARELENLSTDMDTGYWWDTFSNSDKIQSIENITTDTKNRKAILTDINGQIVHRSNEIGFLSDKVKFFVIRTKSNEITSLASPGNIGDTSIAVRGGAVTINE